MPSSGDGGGGPGGLDALARRVDQIDVVLQRVDVRVEDISQRMGRLETRMDRLETRFDGIDARLRAVEQVGAANSAKLDLVATQLNTKSVQLAAKLPSWWEITAAIGVTLALIVAAAAGARQLGLF